MCRKLRVPNPYSSPLVYSPHFALNVGRRYSSLPHAGHAYLLIECFMLPYMADNGNENDWLSQLPYPYQPHTGVVGFLLDVSGSMRGALEAGRAEGPVVKRLQAALRAVLKVVKAEQRQLPDARVFVGLFGLDSDADPGCPTQIDLCSVIEALVSDPSGHQSGHDLLVSLAKQNNRAHIEKYIRAKLTDDEARFLYVYLQQEGRESQIDEFIAGIPSDETIENPGKQVRGAVQYAALWRLRYYPYMVQQAHLLAVR